MIDRPGGRRDGLFGLVAELSAGHSAKVALERFLAERGWKGRPVDDEMRRAFLVHVAERYFAVTTAIGRFVGCVGSERENARVRYWKEGENLHGDAVLSFSEPRRLNAGESCTFAEHPSLLFTFGIGGEWGWRRRLSECMPDRSEP